MKWRNIKYNLLLPVRAIKASILCIRFPFLYPRNRFTGEHHSCWTISKYLYLLGQIEYDRVSLEQVNEDKKPPEIRISQRVNDTYYSIYKVNDNGVYTYYLQCNCKYYPINDIDWKDVAYVTFDHQHLCIVYKANVKFRWHFEPLKLEHHKFITFIIKCLKFVKKIIQIVHCIPTYTELDAMPIGWRNAFGIKMCKEIKKQLKKEKFLYKYRITQIKEKFSELRWYSVYSSNELEQIIEKYSEISSHICINCGKPATKYTLGYICPYCDNCFPKEHKSANTLEEAFDEGIL